MKKARLFKNLKNPFSRRLKEKTMLKSDQEFHVSILILRWILQSELMKIKFIFLKFILSYKSIILFKHISLLVDTFRFVFYYICTLNLNIEMNLRYGNWTFYKPTYIFGKSKLTFFFHSDSVYQHYMREAILYGTLSRYSGTLFINKRFGLNKMFQRKASKFAIFYV